MSQRFLFRRSTLPRTGREASGLVAVVSSGDHELHRSNLREEVEVEVGKERNGHCCFHLVTNPPSVRFKSHKRGLLSDRKLVPLKFSSPQRTTVPARTANFTGGFQKLHRRIETEAAPRILYERRDETTSPLRIFGSLVWEEGGKFLLAWQRQYNRSRTKPSLSPRAWMIILGLRTQVTMHYDRDHKTYLDFGNHTEKVRLVIEFGRGIRVTDEEPELKKVPHVGYASLFPFMSKIIPPHSEILEQQLDLISSNELACSDYGLLSLAKTRIKQIHSFVIIKSSMQLFVHDTERSDEPTTMLERSHMDEYELHDSCLPQTLLFSNVVGEYDKTRYIWERYDQTKGTGEGGRNFTGWSALILLIMTEDYPRL
ncbi:hypothetical protein YC2023_121758 [Brassica napus]